MKEKIEGIAFVFGVKSSDIQAVVDQVKASGIFSVQDLCRLHSFGVPVLKKISEIYDISKEDAFDLFDIGPMDYRSLEQVINLTYEQFKPTIDELDRRNADRDRVEKAFIELSEITKEKSNKLFGELTDFVKRSWTGIKPGKIIDEIKGYHWVPEEKTAPGKINRYRLDMVLTHEENKFSETELMDMFVEWVESKGMECIGSLTDVTNEE